MPLHSPLTLASKLFSGQDEQSLLFAPDSKSASVENMVRTNEDTLMTVSGPCPMVLDGTGDIAGESARTYGIGYGEFDGVKHIVRHYDDELQRFKGRWWKNYSLNWPVRLPSRS